MGAREMHCAPAWADGGCADLNARLLEDWRTDCMHGQSATARIYGSNMCILHKIASRIHIDEGGAQMPSTALPRIRSAGGSRQLPSRRRENTGIRSTTADGDLTISTSIPPERILRYPAYRRPGGLRSWCQAKLPRRVGYSLVTRESWTRGSMKTQSIVLCSCTTKS
jgi:hypothetical protein